MSLKSCDLPKNEILNALYSYFQRLFSDEILYGVSLIRAAVLPETLKAQSALEATERKGEKILFFIGYLLV